MTHPHPHLSEKPLPTPQMPKPGNIPICYSLTNELKNKLITFLKAFIDEKQHSSEFQPRSGVSDQAKKYRADISSLFI